MASEVYVFEQSLPSVAQPLRVAPFLAQQILSIGGAASSAFNRSTAMITVTTTTACNIEIGSAPTGGTIKFPLAANTPYDFHVRAGHKIIAVA